MPCTPMPRLAYTLVIAGAWVTVSEKLWVTLPALLAAVNDTE